LDKDYAGLGRLRLFEQVKLAKDYIADNLYQWVQPPGSRGLQQRIPDPLAARDTWIHSTFLDFEYTGMREASLVNKMKFELWDQRATFEDLRDTYRFFGLISKADYTLRVGDLRVQPRIKNELRLEAPVMQTAPKRKEDTLLFTLMTRFPVLTNSEIHLGAEYSLFRQLQDPVPSELQDDYEELIGAFIMSSQVDYLGYRLTSQVGMKVGRKLGEKTTTTSFVTLYAGAE
jgi:hypothetical protein